MQRLNTVLKAKGLRVHTCPKAGRTSIQFAMKDTGYQPVYPDEEGDEYRWMMVRNPFDRLVSAWGYFCNNDESKYIDNNAAFSRLGYYHKMPFSEFLEIALEKHADNEHTRQQKVFAGDFEFDKIVKFENFQEEWAKLAEKFPKIIPELQHHKKSLRGHWEEYFTEEDKLMVRAVFAPDFELYESAGEL